VTGVLPIVSGRSEEIFGVHDIVADGVRVTVRARSALWAEGGHADAPAGTLGVLADNASGYAIIFGAPADHWSVTTELTLDVVRRVPTDGSELLAVAQLLDHDETTGYSSGRIEDARGRTVAHIRQRGMYVPGIPVTPHRPVSEPGAGPTSLWALFGGQVGHDASAAVDVEVSELMVNPLGSLHGGIAVCLAEWAAAAAFSNEIGAPLSTTSIHVAYLRPAPLGTTIRVEAAVRHRGRNLGLCHVTATNEQDKPVFHATMAAGAS
jgi:uncharacterized protein (TIGR00369 family)